MRFRVTKASDRKYESEVDIGTLEDLLSWSLDTGGDVILETPYSPTPIWTLRIYDDYVE